MGLGPIDRGGSGTDVHATPAHTAKQLYQLDPVHARRAFATWVCDQVTFIHVFKNLHPHGPTYRTVRVEFDDYGTAAPQRRRL